MNKVSPSVPSPRGVFVGGYMHSGTTMIRNLVANHPDVHAILTETRFFETLSYQESNFDLKASTGMEEYLSFLQGCIYSGFATHRHKSPPKKDRKETAEWFSILPESISHCSVFKRVLDHLAHKNEKKIWIEKTPTNVYYLQEILQSFPDSKVIIINRDIRDVITSKSLREKDLAQFDHLDPEQRKVKNLEKDSNLVADCYGWKKSIKNSNKFKNNDRVFIISYDDFVRQPISGTKALCGFLDLPYLEQMMNISNTNTSRMQDVGSFGITSKETKKWKSTLTQPEISAVQTFCLKELKSLNLEVQPIGIQDKIKAYVVLLGEFFRVFRRIQKRLLMFNPTYSRIFIKHIFRRISQ